jgi:hypothetical protein
MNDITHELLNKLRIIGKLKEGQSLDTSNGLSVYNPYGLMGWWNWALRKKVGDNKNECVRAVRDLYKALQQTIKTIIGEMRTTTNQEKKTECIYVIINITVEIKNSIKGLDNLTKTYREYPTTISELEGVLKDYVIVTYSTLLDAIPAEKKPHILEESILYAGQTIYKGNEETKDQLTDELNN